MRASVCISLVLFGAGCNNDLPKQSIVNKLRILAVRSEPAELLLGGPLPASTLNALAVDPSGKPIELQWALCPLPADLPPPARLDCPGSQGIALPADSSSAARLDLSDPRTQPLWNVLYLTPDGTPLTDAQRAALLETGTRTVVGFSARTSSEQLDGFAEVPLRNPGAPINHNPTMRALMVDGTELASDGSNALAAGVKVRLQPVPADDAKEDLGQGRREALNFSFFATDGDVSSLRSADETTTGQPVDSSIDYTAPHATGPVQLWVVVRDGRGGVGWLTRTVQVR